MLIAAWGVVTAPAAAQSSARADDAVSKMVTLAARTGAPRLSAIDRSAHDAVRLTARDTTPITDSLSTPYRSTPSEDVSPGGFAMRLPGTHLDLTNGSLTIGRTNDERHARGIHVSVALTYW